MRREGFGVHEVGVRSPRCMRAARVCSAVGSHPVVMVCTVWGTRARQVLDLRRSLQKLDMAERELASAFVGAVVSSALPNSAFADPASAHLPSPWAGSLGGFVPERACAPAGNGCGNVLEGGGCEEGPDGFEEMVVKDVADEARMVLNEVEEEEEEEGEEEGEEDRAAGGIAAAAAERSSFEKSSQQRRSMNERKKSPMAVVIDSQSPPTCRQKSVDSEEAGGTVAQAESSMNPDGQGHVGENRLMHSSQQPTPTEREEKEGLERLLDALTPQEQNSPQKRASTVRSSVGFRRSMRTSLSIQLGIVPSSPAVGVGSAVVTSNHSKSSSSGLGGSSRFRALGALSSSGEPTPVTAGSRDKAQVSVPRSSGSQGEAARRPASREQHLPATPNPPGGGNSPAIRGTEGMAVGAATAGSADVITTRDPINPNYQVHASSGSHTLKLEAGCGGEEGKGVADWGLETRSSFRHDQMEDTDQCLIGR